MAIYFSGIFPQNSDSGGGGGAVNWGAISGTLSNQTDLQTALNAKQNLVSAPIANDFLFVNSSGQAIDSGLSFSNTSTANSNTIIMSSSAVQSAISNAISTGTSFRGGYDASTNVFPSTGGSGTGGAIVAGNYWIITVAGTLGTVAVVPNDTITALVATPSQTASNWAIRNTVVNSVFGRTGIITAQTGDYSISQITNGLSNSLTQNYFLIGNASNIATPTTLSGTLTVLGLNANNSPSFASLNLTNTTNQIALGTTNTVTITTIGTGITAPRLFTLPDSNSNSIIPLTSAVANSFLTYIGSDGVQRYAQPSTSNLTTAINGLLKGNGSGVVVAVAGTDYQTPLTFSTGLTNSSGTITVNTSQNINQLNNLTTAGFVKTDASGNLSIDTNTYISALSPSFAGTVTATTSTANTLSFRGTNTATQNTTTGGMFQLVQNDLATMSTNNVLGNLQFAGAYNNTNGIGVGAQILSVATTTWVGAAQLGANLLFQVTATASNTLTTALTLNSNATATFASSVTATNLNLTNNTNQLVFGTTNTMTVTMSALTGSRTFTLPNANCNPIQPIAAVTNKFVTNIDSTGTQQLEFVTLAGCSDVAFASPANGEMLVYNSSTGKWTDSNNVNELICGNPGLEGSGISINNVTYESTFKVSDIAGTNLAQTILHKHSTTIQPLILFARSNSNTNAHANVTAGMTLGSIFASGYAGTNNYQVFGSIDFLASTTGSISNTSAPGAIKINVTPNGGITPVEAILIDQDKSARFAGAATIAGTLLAQQAIRFSNFGQGILNSNPTGDLSILTGTSNKEILYYNGSNYLFGLKAPINQINVVPYKTNGTYTYTPTPGMVYCIVKMVGAGGGGGGAGTTSSTQYSAGGGGGSGGYVEVLFTAAQIGASQTIVLAAGGAGGTGNTAASNASDSTFGSFITCGGGDGGQVVTSSTTFGSQPASGGTNIITTGLELVNLQGQAGIGGMVTITGDSKGVMSFSGGGSNPLGQGAILRINPSSQTAGSPTGNGSGGGGASNNVSTAQKTGTSGRPAACYIIEYICA